MTGAADTAKVVVTALALLAAQGTALAALVAVIQRIAGRRLPPAWLAAAWLIVFVKLVLPWGPAMPWSLADLFAAAAPATDVPSAAALPFLPPAAAHASPLWLVLAGLWLAGSCALLARAVLGYRTARVAAVRAPLASAAAQTLVSELAAELRVRAPRLALGAAHTGPHVVGVRRPIIVVPPALAAEPALLRAALLHELAHIRRRDVVGRAIQVVATSLFFFWPVFRLAGRRLDLAREAACDACALDASQLPRPTYARLLVQMAQLRTHAGALAMSARQPSGQLQARIAAVLGAPIRARLTPLHRLAIAAWAVVALGGARAAHASPDHPACSYTPQLAAQLYIAYPEADRDRDGALSRDEACELQAELRARLDGRGSTAAGSADGTPADPMATLEATRLVNEPLCCNCDEAEGQPLAATLPYANE